MKQQGTYHSVLALMEKILIILYRQEESKKYAVHGGIS